MTAKVCKYCDGLGYYIIASDEVDEYGDRYPIQIPCPCCDGGEELDHPTPDEYQN